MLNNILFSIVIFLVLASANGTLRCQQSLLDQDERGWRTLSPGQTLFGIRYDNSGAVIVNNKLVMGCVPDPQSAYGITVRREVASAFARYQGAARAAEIYRVGVQGQASANLDVVRQTYELGSKTLLDFIAEQRRFIEVQNGYIEALVATYQARVEIERASASPELIKR
jgi:hypothetical protein